MGSTYACSRLFLHCEGRPLQTRRRPAFIKVFQSCPRLQQMLGVCYIAHCQDGSHGEAYTCANYFLICDGQFLHASCTYLQCGVWQPSVAVFGVRRVTRQHVWWREPWAAVRLPFWRPVPTGAGIDNIYSGCDKVCRYL
jgi:hypothetical protein